MTIESVLKAYEAALNASDADAVMRLYGAEPVFMPQHVPALVGRDAVRAGYDHVFAAIKLAVTFEIHEIEAGPDRGWARTSSAGTQTVLATGETSREGNNELFVFHHEEGEWKIHRYLFATNQPPRG